MSNQQTFNAPSDLVIQLEIVPEDEHYPDIVDYLRENGYTVEPAYTATKGNPTFDIIVHVYQIIHDNKEWITAMFSTASLALQYLIKERDKRIEKDKTQRSPLEITLYVNGHTVSSNASNPTELVEQSEGTFTKNTKIQIKVPKKKRHHTR